MKLHIFGSSSKGNGYALVDSQGSTLLLECGVNFLEVQKALDFEIGTILGVLVSHEHLDHSKYVKQYLSYGIDVYSNEAVFKRHDINTHHRCHDLLLKETYTLGEFTIKAFDVIHDVPTLGFMISHPEMGIALFATDTYYFPYRFSKVNHWIVEANYDKEIIDDKSHGGEENIALRNRIIQSHMSIENLIKMLDANDMSHTKNIVLCHLSDRNSHEVNFVSAMREKFGTPAHIADPGKVIPLDLIPF